MSFDADHRLSFDWSAYPIARFTDMPGKIEVHVIDRPRQPFLGTGEASQGPAAAAPMPEAAPLTTYVLMPWRSGGRPSCR